MHLKVFMNEQGGIEILERRVLGSLSYTLELLLTHKVKYFNNITFFFFKV